jgi:hypothetical protein
MHSTDDLNDGYMGSGQQLRRSVKKHGRDQHKTDVLEFLPDRESLGLREEELITKKLMEDELCMNLATGGQGKVDRPLVTKESTSAKLSEKSKALWTTRREEGYTPPPQSSASIAKRVAKNTGKKRTPAQLANLAQGQQGYYTSVDHEVLKERGQAAARTRVERGSNLGGRPKGTPMSEEQKARQSAATKGKSLSAEHCEALRKPKIRAVCQHCGKETTVGALKRYHAACS